MTLTMRPAAPLEPPRVVATRTVRKVALCGSHSASLTDAPWQDPSWEFWGHASSRGWYRRQMDRYFDLHPRACWTRGGKKGDGYPKFLARNTVPIYMQQRFPEVPASVEYPRGRIMTEFSDSRPYYTSQVAWMIALALTEGVSAIGLYGINYGTEGEYLNQRGSAEYWLGRAAERGVRVVLPEQCTLLREPALLYGYESHDEVTGLLRDEYRPRLWGKVRVPAGDGDALEPPPEIRAMMEAEEREHPRPEWSLGYRLPEKPNGKAVTA